MRLLTAIAVLMLCGGVLAQSAPPAAPMDAKTLAALQLRGNEAFNQGKYMSALPILQRVANQLKTQPDQADALAMVQEQIRVCQKNLVPASAMPAAPAASTPAASTPAVSTPAASTPAASAATGSGPGSVPLPPMPPPVGASASASPTLVASATPSNALPPMPPSAVTSVGDTSALPANTGGPTIPMGADRIPHPAPKPGQTLEMSIKELGNFEFDPDHPTPLPSDVMALSGSTIRLRGYMIPMDQAESITQFALVPSLFACCYGQPPQIQHTIVVDCPKGKAVSYFPDEIVVTGKLNVQVKKDDGFIVSLFEVQASSVKPAPK